MALQDHIDNIYRAFGLDPKDFAVPKGIEWHALDHHLANITALLASGAGGSGGGSGVTAHNLLSNRNMADQHPISAVTGLQAALDAVNNAINTHKSSPTDHNDIRQAIALLEQAVNSAVKISEKGVANGVAALGSDGKVPVSQLPDIPRITNTEIQNIINSL
jgi:hypothetical protein